MRKGFLATAICMWMLLLLPLQVHATTVYENENGYQAIIVDEDKVLSELQTSKLTDKMKPITEYGNVAVIIKTDYQYSAYTYPQEYILEQWGNESAIALAVDWKEKEFGYDSEGALRRYISDDKANTWRYEERKYLDTDDYYICLAGMLEKIYGALEEKQNTGSLSDIGLILVALIIAMLVMYFVVNRSMKKHVIVETDWLEGVTAEQDILDFHEHLLHETKKLVPGSSKYQESVDDFFKGDNYN